jgi:outer membrane lipoprotein-sorting protein
VRRNARLLWFAAVAAALLAAPIDARAAQDGYALLRSAVKADDHVSFSGTVTSLVYGTSAATATVVRIEHRAPNDWRLWYVAPADAYGRLILSNESVTYQYEPKTGKVFSNDWAAMSPFAASTLDLGRIKRNYSVQAVDHAGVAGRQARTLSLISNYSHALVLRLWVDNATGLVLRRETYHSDGTIATKTSFDNIRFVKDLPNDLFKMSVPAGMTLTPGAEYGKATTDIASVTTGLRFKTVDPSSLPDGFTLDKGSSELRGGVQTVQFVYSDGLRSFSLFENPTGRFPTFDGPDPKPIAVGKQNGEYTSVAGEWMLSWNAQGVNFIIVGDVTPKELARIAASLAQ